MAIPSLQAFTASVGPQPTSDGLTSLQRLERSGALVTDELHGRYYETTYRRNTFNCSAIGLTTTAAATVNPFAGLMIWNPVTSSANLVINKFGYAWYVIPTAAAVIGIMTGYSLVPAWGTLTTGTILGSFVGQPAGQAIAWTAATSSVATAALNRVVASGLGTGGALTTNVILPLSYHDLEGSLIIPPGGFVASYTGTASGAAGAAFSFSWEEVPL